MDPMIEHPCADLIRNDSGESQETRHFADPRIILGAIAVDINLEKLEELRSLYGQRAEASTNDDVGCIGMHMVKYRLAHGQVSA